MSLGLDEFDGDLYADDTNGTPIEDLTPDYGILEQIDYTYPVNDAYFTYASRVASENANLRVPALEGQQRDTYSVSSVVQNVDRLYGQKKTSS